MSKAKPVAQKWEYKPRPKTVLGKCTSCLKQNHYTLTAFPHLYAEALLKQACHGCRRVGTLITSDLAKAKPKRNTGQQLPLELFPVTPRRRP
jgi:hypothetical protein